MLGKRPLRLALSLCLAPALAGAADEPSTAAQGRERLLALHAGDAASYAIFRDPARSERLELRREPIYRWSNPTRVGGQEGDVFVWTYKGRPDVVASIFSHPHGPDRAQRCVCHELHSLSEAVLVVERDSPNRWEPRAAGVAMKSVPGAPVPAGSAAQREVQLRALARDFSGRSLSDQGQEWDLRPIPRPLLRYESSDLGVVDGALLVLRSTAGTDPEIVLLLEARTSPDGPRWEYGAARFSDMSLWLKYKGQEVWSMIRGPENTFNSDAQGRFRFYQDRIIPEVKSDAPAPAPTAKKAEE
jgi:hypothetical protein